MSLSEFGERRVGFARTAVLSALVWALVLASAGVSVAQGLRFGNHREIKPPDYALLRIGPFYSSLYFQQSAGYRYVRTRGTGTDFLINNRRGHIREDGHELPLISTLSMRNYLIVSKNVDVDLSVLMRWEYYPLDTQEDEFIVDMAEEGIYGTFSSEFILTPFVKGTAYESFAYLTDYVDARGIEDRHGGRRYEYLNNRIGLDMDWLMSKKQNLGLELRRTDNIPRDDEFAFQEYAGHYAGLIYQYSLLQGLVVGARGSARQVSYDEPGRSDTRSEDLSLFANFSKGQRAGLRVTRATTLNGRVGFASGYNRGVLDTNETDHTTVVGELELETELSRGLSHSIYYTRRIRDGFNTSFEVADSYGYRVSWVRDTLKADAYTSFSRAQPSNLALGDYDTWRSGIDASYPLTRYIRLVGSTDYSRRGARGSTPQLDPDLDPELLYDYNTWVSRIGTSFALTKKIGFSTYYQHIKRDSDSEDLAYTRDIFAATCSFSHQF